MNRYFDERDDEDGFGLLPFFMAIRAAVRAHVIATQSEEPGQDSVPLAAEARSYFELAQRLLNRVEPQMIAIGGLSGSGKTTVADMMAARIGAAPGARVLESDRIRKALHGVVAETRLPVTAYSAEMSAKVYREMARHAAIILAQGGSVIAGAVFDDPANRRLMEEAASGVADAHFDGIWLQAPQETLWRRVHDRPKGPSDATTDVLSGQLTRQSTDAGWEPIDASPPPETVVAMILFRHSGRNGVAACVRPPAVPRNPESSAFHKGRYSGHPSF
jgi:predicted kinase